ncbi:MAG TPA: FGGY-family carbohydrate kinase, partial [Niastella sp.]|nr:FGGY-family carbohydrate kinase [Niastella sp.]
VGAIHTLFVSGGLVHSRIWMQLLADVTGKNVCISRTEDASGLGAVLLYFKTLEKAEPLQVEGWETIVPDAGNHNLYREPLQLFQSLYDTLKTTMHQLS